MHRHKKGGGLNSKCSPGNVAWWVKWERLASWSTPIRSSFDAIFYKIVIVTFTKEKDTMQKVEIANCEDLNIHCPLCGQLTISIDGLSQCEHTLFHASDEGFEYVSINLGFSTDIITGDKNIDEFTDGIEYPNAIKLEPIPEPLWDRRMGTDIANLQGFGIASSNSPTGSEFFSGICCIFQQAVTIHLYSFLDQLSYLVES